MFGYDDAEVSVSDLLTPSYVGKAPNVYDYVETDPLQPYADTSVGGITISDGGLFPNNVNTSGNWLTAATNGANLAPPSVATPSWLDRVETVFAKAGLQLVGSGVKAGSAAADKAIADAVGGQNPPPQNTNTNLANKGLSYLTSMLQQLRLGSSGMTAGGTTAQAQQKNTVAILLGVGALVVLFAVLLGRR